MTNGLPVDLPLLCRRPIKKMIFFHYPRVSPGAAPLTKKPEDSGYEIDHVLGDRGKVRIGHFRVAVNLIIKARLRAKFLL